jgi:C_GCAxxG_C_C family probable redox protein
MKTLMNPEDQQEVLALRAKEILAESGNCAQTAFAVLQEAFDLEGGPILRALTPFPGIALRGETCGAVTGCLMALGLVYGRDELDDWRGYIGSLPPARRFCRRFSEQHGGTACADVLIEKLGRDYDLADRTQALAYVTSDGPEACAQVVAGATVIASELLSKAVNQRADGMTPE